MSNTRFTSGVELATGIGLRVPHYNHILAEKPAVGWFEIISENYMVEGGRALAVLDRILDQYRVVQHGVGLYPGDAGGVKFDHLRRLKRLVRQLKGSASRSAALAERSTGPEERSTGPAQG